MWMTQTNPDPYHREYYACQVFSKSVQQQWLGGEVEQTNEQTDKKRFFIIKVYEQLARIALCCGIE